jgi:hypothetical protein
LATSWCWTSGRRRPYGVVAAAGLGDARAMAHLCGVYDFLGEEADAEHWYRRGAELGDPIAVQDLAALTRMRERESG